VIQVTLHAIQRFQERIAAVDAAEARRRILQHEPAMLVAVRFGARCVRCPDGMRLILQDGFVTTVFGREMRLGRPGQTKGTRQ